MSAKINIKYRGEIRTLGHRSWMRQHVTVFPWNVTRSAIDLISFDLFFICTDIPALSCPSLLSFETWKFTVSTKPFAHLRCFLHASWNFIRNSSKHESTPERLFFFYFTILRIRNQVAWNYRAEKYSGILKPISTKIHLDAHDREFIEFTLNL